MAGVLSACESILERSNRSGGIPMLVGASLRTSAGCRRATVSTKRGSARATRWELSSRHPFVAQKAFEQARNFSADELREAIVRLADLDLAVKGGSRLPPELELERTLVAITRSSEAS